MKLEKNFTSPHLIVHTKSILLPLKLLLFILFIFLLTPALTFPTLFFLELPGDGELPEGALC